MFQRPGCGADDAQELSAVTRACGVVVSRLLRTKSASSDCVCKRSPVQSRTRPSFFLPFLPSVFYDGYFLSTLFLHVSSSYPWPRPMKLWYSLRARLASAISWNIRSDNKQVRTDAQSHRTRSHALLATYLMLSLLAYRRLQSRRVRCQHPIAHHQIFIVRTRAMLMSRCDSKPSMNPPLAPFSYIEIIHVRPLFPHATASWDIRTDGCHPTASEAASAYVPRFLRRIESTWSVCRSGFQRDQAKHGSDIRFSHC